MSYAIGSKSNTRGKMAVAVPCIVCGARCRVYRQPSATSAQPCVASCPPCRRSGEVMPLVTDLCERVVKPQMAAWLAENPYELRPAEEYVRGRLTEYQIAHERQRQAVWERAIAESLAERGVSNACAPVALAV
ncbi:MAG: hypothetical protein AB7P40_00210 [Chloroflexota bacterium]